jgi:hypothetical protein
LAALGNTNPFYAALSQEAAAPFMDGNALAQLAGLPRQGAQVWTQGRYNALDPPKGVQDALSQLAQMQGQQLNRSDLSRPPFWVKNCTARLADWADRSYEQALELRTEALADAAVMAQRRKRQRTRALAMRALLQSGAHMPARSFQPLGRVAPFLAPNRERRWEFARLAGVGRRG